MHTLFPATVRLNQEDHTYTDNLGNYYISFSKFYKFICEPFDADSVSRFVAKGSGVEQAEVLDKWRGQTDEGTRIDNALELYAKTGQILVENEDIADMVKSINAEYAKYNKCYEQLVVYNKDYRVSGTLDKLFLFSNRKDSAFGISDFKAFDDKYDKDGNFVHSNYEGLFVHRGWLLSPFDYLPNTKYTKISFQLSFYAHLFEELTGRKCKELFIHLANPKTKTHQKVPVMYMKREVMHALEYHKNKVMVELEMMEGF